MDINKNRAYAKASLNRNFFDILCHLIQKKKKGNTGSGNLERFHIKTVSICRCCTVKLTGKARLQQIDLIHEAGITTAKLTNFYFLYSGSHYLGIKQNGLSALNKLDNCFKKNLS